ncbi:hypothetical protein GUJ93_ZPchr0004g38593 [Zizania palustris]|uniref:Uncharacterized protein n=1 Tax=Zizania palustris TaxID=103762 RepID=A0A8J5VQ08_ZIZPA|nr:hypothetical protein GUJ93_ZPchr0004g38593 [Zizania palustris]
MLPPRRPPLRGPCPQALAPRPHGTPCRNSLPCPYSSFDVSKREAGARTGNEPSRLVRGIRWTTKGMEASETTGATWIGMEGASWNGDGLATAACRSQEETNKEDGGRRELPRAGVVTGWRGLHRVVTGRRRPPWTVGSSGAVARRRATGGNDVASVLKRLATSNKEEEAARGSRENKK